MNVRAFRNFPLFLGIGFFVLGSVFTGCGYYFRATGAPMGIKLDSLAIPMVESTSSNIGFEAAFTKNVRDKFISQGKVPLVSTEEAQAVLSGRVYDIRIEPLSYRTEQQLVSGVLTTFEVTTSRRLVVKLEMQLKDMKTGKVIWHEKAIEEKGTFAVSEDPLVTQFNQRLALEVIARTLADRIFLKTMERF
ncbi:MAG: hypothetical protein HKM90_09905 [Desulfobacteraceae bacterium]|nr:hypothetical protein [Desulfobacteraceae bacterium]